LLLFPFDYNLRWLTLGLGLFSNQVAAVSLLRSFVSLFHAWFRRVFHSRSYTIIERKFILCLCSWLEDYFIEYHDQSIPYNMSDDESSIPAGIPNVALCPEILRVSLPVIDDLVRNYDSQSS
jgi:hypothetical protein